MRPTLFLLLMLLAYPTQGFGFEENKALCKLLETRQVRGTIVVFDVSAGLVSGCDKARAEARFVPASTFKILNSLIGLSVQAVKSVDEVLPYGGGEQALDSWEEDMGLRKAIAISNVPIYQELARRIGLERMQRHVAKVQYGNAQVGSVVDRFWLSGPLKISAVEQTKFLADLAANKLPFPVSVQESVKEIIGLEQGKDWKLFGKTGWENAPQRGIGWWVGWLEKQGRIYSVAVNIDMDQGVDPNQRLEIGKASLKELGILDGS